MYLIVPFIRISNIVMHECPWLKGLINQVNIRIDDSMHQINESFSIIIYYLVDTRISADNGS